MASNEVAPVRTPSAVRDRPGGRAGSRAADDQVRVARDGSTITARTPVTADITPPTGQTIDQWCLTALRVGDDARTTVKCGTGAPSSRDVGTFDPTTLPNGTYQLELDATASGGGEGYVTMTVSVSGALKPGRYALSYTDMDLPIQTLPIRVTRSYDSFDKSKGDFVSAGALALTASAYRLTAARRAGWTSQGANCFEVLGELACLTNGLGDLRSHTATVTWPDGHAETFDFTPKAQTGGVVLGGTAGFTPARARPRRCAPSAIRR